MPLHDKEQQVHDDLERYIAQKRRFITALALLFLMLSSGSGFIVECMMRNQNARRGLVPVKNPLDLDNIFPTPPQNSTQRPALTAFNPFTPFCGTDQSVFPDIFIPYQYEGVTYPSIDHFSTRAVVNLILTWGDTFERPYMLSEHDRYEMAQVICALHGIPRDSLTTDPLLYMDINSQSRVAGNNVRRSLSQQHPELASALRMIAVQNFSEAKYQEIEAKFGRFVEVSLGAGEDKHRHRTHAK